ncbi:beta-carotene hydroxylase [Scenedesmus sp. NREL 46B-D3]|nr:beta-carotene hydroxylase [Scenedesmus sp. NREL 46B-D3]
MVSTNALSCSSSRGLVAASKPHVSRLNQGCRPVLVPGRITQLRAAADESVQQDAASQIAQNAQELAQSIELAQKSASKRLQRRRQQLTYQASAIAATTGVGALAILATYYKFVYHMGGSPDAAFPWADMCGTLALVVGGVVGMEMWARWAHRALWHDFVPGWALHKSHHEPRIGPFEANDVYAIMNAVPAIALCLYGFLTPTMTGSLCFGGGLGITLFGIAYMFVHDGLVHKRFPTGPIAELPYMKRVTVAHRLHHSEKYNGVPWGLFLGPQELEAIGAGPELDRLVEELEVRSTAPSRK